MKVGTENRRNIIILLTLTLLAVYAVSRFYFGRPTVSANTPVPGTAATTPAKKPALPSRTGKKLPRRAPLVASLDPTLRFDLLKSGEDQEYSGGKRNIFQPQAEEIPKPKGNGLKPTPQPPPIQQPPQPPPPPPIPFKFYGFSNRPGEAKQAFLSNGDDVFIGKEGEIINRRYRIVRINASTIEIEDVLNNNKQVIPLTQG